VVAARAQELDELGARLRRRIEQRLKRQHQATTKLGSRLFARHPRSVIAEQRARLAPVRGELEAAVRAKLTEAREHLVRDAARLNALSPLAVLGRGYAIVLDSEGRAVRRAADTARGKALQVRLAEGTLGVVVETANPPEDVG